MAAAAASIRATTVKLSEGKPITGQEAYDAITDMMTGNATEAQAGAFLGLLRLNLCTPEVIAGAAKAMRAQAMPCQTPLDTLDIVGTGGDGIDTFNVSTCAAFVCAAVEGVNVMKHGNRSNSSLCGSADLLEALGARLDVTGDQAVRVMQRCGFCFLFAQKFHPSMRFVGPARKQTGVRSIFNILGPLTNPCVPSSQLAGVFDMSLGRPYADTFVKLGMKRAMVVNAHNGLDEISPEGLTHAWFVEDGVVTERDIGAADFGVKEHKMETCAGGMPVYNVQCLWDCLSGKEGPLLDYLLMNAGAALYVAGKADTLKEGADVARKAIQSGAARQVVEGYVRESNAVIHEDEEALSILAKISKHRAKQVADQKKKVPEAQLTRASLVCPPAAPLDVVARIRKAPTAIALMAEIKRASPSAGDIFADVDPVAQALAYAQGGASLISVLTEPHWFKGHIDDLKAVSQALRALPDRPAVLLKDFVGDEYQLVEARAAGADTALLIVASLSEQRLRELMECARGLGMEPLVEVASEEELQTALRVGAKLVGVNNRDLHTFKMDMTKTPRLHALLPEGCGVTMCALSGVKTREDVAPLEALANVKGVLVGETLMRAEDPTACIAGLLGVDDAVKARQHRTKVKVCGVRSVEGALAAARAGAAMIGLIFVGKSKRCVSVDEAKRIVEGLREHFPKACSKDTVDKNQPLDQRLLVQHPLVVGVFQNQSIEELNRVATEVGLDLVQLHGDEPDACIADLVVPAVQVVHVEPGKSTAKQCAEQAASARAAGCAMVLLDTKSSAGAGGTGKTFDWRIAHEVARQGPVMLAGGLHPGNVSMAVQQVRPWGVDVASGTENTGVVGKVKGKVYSFVHNAHTA